MEKKLGLLIVAKEKYLRELMLVPPIWALGIIAIRIKQEARLMSYVPSQMKKLEVAVHMVVKVLYTIINAIHRFSRRLVSELKL